MNATINPFMAENKNNNKHPTPTPSKIVKPNNKPSLQKAVKAAVVQQAAQKLAAKASKVTERKVAEKIVAKAEKEPKKSFLQKIAGVAGKAWNWLQEGGWETLLTVGTILAVTDENNDNRYTKHLAGAGSIPSGTVIAKIPISADMFDDVNDRLQRQLSLYTYYAFTNSSIHFKGAQGDLVNGQIGMFIVPDPDLIIASDDSAAIVRLIREYGGRIMKLNQSGNIKIPEVGRLLSVQPGMTDERRSYVQGTLYIVAVTDLDYDGPLGEFAIQYNIEMTKAANSGLVSLAEVSSKQMSFGVVNFPNFTPAGPKQNDYEDQYNQSYTDFIRSHDLMASSYPFTNTVGQYAQFPPGVYRITPFALSIFSTNGPASSDNTYFQAYVCQVTTSQNPVWNAQNDPSVENPTVVGSVPISMIRSSSELTTASISIPDLLTVQTQPFYVGYSAGILQNGGDISGNDVLGFNLNFCVVQLQQFPIDGFSYQLETEALMAAYEPYVLPRRDKKEQKQPVQGEKGNASPQRRNSSVPPRP